MSVKEENGISVLEQMNQLLEEKESIIDNKRKKLEVYEKELKVLEEQIARKSNALKIEQKQINQAKIDLENRVAEENAKLEARWDEIRKYEETVQTSMEKVLSEKLLLERAENEKLKLEYETESPLLGENLEFDIGKLKESLGIDDELLSAVDVVAEEVVKEPQDESVVVDTVKSVDFEEDIPEVFKKLEKEISKSYSKWQCIELLPERYCLQSGDNEVRFFDYGEHNEVQIVIPYKNAKTDRRLQTKLISISRAAQEWNISTEDNQIICVMPFAKGTKESLVLKKCNDFIKTHF